MVHLASTYSSISKIPKVKRFKKQRRGERNLSDFQLEWWKFSLENLEGAVVASLWKKSIQSDDKFHFIWRTKKNNDDAEVQN